MDMQRLKYNLAMPLPGKQKTFLRQLLHGFGWTRSSSVLLGGFFLVVMLIVYIWWPIAEEVLAYINWGGSWWLFFDWLLVGIFLFMTLTIMSRADLRVDALIVLVGTLGGLVIESWGTQTNLWFYFTAQRPPLWIIPAWPIASLSIDRITRLGNFLINKLSNENTQESHGSLLFQVLYWLIFSSFLILMLVFVAPTIGKSYTILAILLVVLLILTPTDHRMAVMTFVAGAGLGYFLELWGTTRQCWTYYTYQTPPLFAVLAHGMAAVSFWRAGLLMRQVWGKLTKWFRFRESNLQKT